MEAGRLREYLDAACAAARLGGQALLEWQPRFSVREKGRFDLVTDADLASQEAVRTHLLGAFPGHRFLGEEEENSSAALTQPGPPTWVVDPLDGTTNYVHGYPAFAVSIGLAHEGTLLAGVVYDPSREEMFAAARGQGAFLNGRPIRTTAADSLGQALLSTGFPADLTGHQAIIEVWNHLSFRTQSLRRTGSTALNLAYVAAGRFDGFWHFLSLPWDIAAGCLLVLEAGGKITDMDGGRFDLACRDLIASNGPLHPAMVCEIAAGRRRKDAE